MEFGIAKNIKMVKFQFNNTTIIKIINIEIHFVTYKKENVSEIESTHVRKN